MDFPEFVVLGEKITSVDIVPIAFKAQTEIEDKANGPKDLARRRMKAAIRLNGKPITDEQINDIDLRTGMRLRGAMAEAMEGGDAGDVLSGDADGIDKPILYRFGTPLYIETTKGRVEIKEVEIQARRYADLEDIISQPSLGKMLIEMMGRIAIPTNKDLITMPIFALDTLTTADATKIIDEVLMGFLSVDDE